MIILSLGVLALGRAWQATLWVAACVAVSTIVSAAIAVPSYLPTEVAQVAAINAAIGAAVGSAAFVAKKVWLNAGRPKTKRPGPAGQR